MDIDIIKKHIMERCLCFQVPDDEVTEMSEATEATDATDISEASDQDNNKKVSMMLLHFVTLSYIKPIHF